MSATIIIGTGFIANPHRDELDSADYMGVDEFGRTLYETSSALGIIVRPMELLIFGMAYPVSVEGWSLDQLFQVIDWSDEYGEAFGVFLSLGMHTESDPDMWGDQFNDSYQGEWESEGAWLEDYLEDMGETPNSTLVVDWDVSFRYGGYNTEYTLENGYMFRNV